MTKEYMAKITRIKATDAPGSSPEPTKSSSRQKAVTKTASAKKPVKMAKVASKSPKIAKKQAKQAKKQTKKDQKVKKPMPKWLRIITWPFRTLAIPFIALSRYIHDSWVEIRQVRWPNRKSTWKSVLAVLIYAALIIAFITLLDALFTFIFNKLLGV